MKTGKIIGRSNQSNEEARIEIIQLHKETKLKDVLDDLLEEESYGDISVELNFPHKDKKYFLPKDLSNIINYTCRSTIHVYKGEGRADYKIKLYNNYGETNVN